MFRRYFEKALLSEFNTAGAGGVFGDGGDIGQGGGAVNKGAGYADGDARVPTVLGGTKVDTRKKKKKKKKSKKHTSIFTGFSDKLDKKMTIQRRAMHKGL